MTRKRPYFSLYEVALMSLCGALVFVLKVTLKIPFHLPGHSGIFWVIPLLVGIAVVRKPGSGTYIGIVSGVLASFFGTEVLHLFNVFDYTAMGVVADITSFAFRYRLDNPAVGFVAGAAGNLAKMVVNYSIQLLFGVQATFILLGIGIASVSHLVFGGLGGIIAALIIGRLARAGVIVKDAGNDAGPPPD